MPMKYEHLSALCLVLAMSAGVCQAQPQTNMITTPGGAFSYTVNGVAGNPTLNLTAGVTNVFQISTVWVHPVVISPPPPKGFFTLYSGQSPQSPSINSGTETLATPATGFPTK